MKPMSSTEAKERFQCQRCASDDSTGCMLDCVVSSTCSLLCHNCRRANFFPGDLETAPKSFLCYYCGEVIVKQIRVGELK